MLINWQREITISLIFMAVMIIGIMIITVTILKIVSRDNEEEQNGTSKKDDEVN